MGVVGVVGLKIDFFESDRAERVAQYDMLATGRPSTGDAQLSRRTKPAGEIRNLAHVSPRGRDGPRIPAELFHLSAGGPDAATTAPCDHPQRRRAMVSPRCL